MLFSILTPLGPVTIEERDGALARLAFTPQAPATPPPTPLLEQAEAQLREYFAGERRQFTLPLRPEGTPFQQAVWQALGRIPYGATCSYADLARAVGRPNACRAVGNANGHNPLPILIPCHRVIAADGSLGGYTGGLDKKALLLQLERAHAPQP